MKNISKETLEVLKENRDVIIQQIEREKNWDMETSDVMRVVAKNADLGCYKWSIMEDLNDIIPDSISEILDGAISENILAGEKMAEINKEASFKIMTAR